MRHDSAGGKGSRLGVSILLRQAHGFEGLLPPREATEPDASAVANGEHMSDRLFKWHRTALQLAVLMNEDQDAVIVQLDEPLGVETQPAVGVKPHLGELENLRPPGEAQGGSVTHDIPLDIGVDELRESLHAALVDSRVRPASNLDTLERHRPGSIPQAQESA